MNTVLYAQKFKDPLSLIMKDVEQETYKTEDIKEEECVMGNTELIRSSLEDLHRLLQNSEEYIEKVIVTCIKNTKYRKAKYKGSGK